MWVGIGVAIASYLLGSISFGLVIAGRRGVDLRGEGSGNIGATNVGRVMGAETGRTVMALDALKGIAGALAARFWFGVESPWTALAGICAVLGHVFPIWHRFRGGKGAATALGVMLATVPLAGLVAGVTFFVLKKTTRRASAGSVLGALAGTLVTAALHRGSWLTAMTVGVLVIVWVRHIGNIKRLLRGEEPPS